MVSDPLSTSQRQGSIVVAMFALLSALALAYITLRAIRLALLLFLKRDNTMSRPLNILFFRTQLGHYAGCLVLANMFISAAGLVDFSWVSRSGLSRGSACSAQAVLRQIGIWSTCWFTAAHGLHTLSSLGFRVRPARWLSSVNVALGWVISCIAGLVPLRKSNMYGPTGISCSITPSYSREIFALEVLPIILAALVSTGAYSVIFAVLHGKLRVNSGQRLRASNPTSSRGSENFEEGFRFMSVIIRTMFWFPLAFVLLLLPFCITHIIAYAGDSVPSALSVFADACVSMLGLVNVILLHNTFRVIRPVYRGPVVKVVTETTMDFGHDALGDPPIVPRPTVGSQPATPSYERTYNFTQSSPPHLRNSSWASVDSNAGLDAEKALSEPTRTKVALLTLNNIIPPADFSRYPGLISPKGVTQRQDINSQPRVIISSPSPTVSSLSPSPRAPIVTRDTGHKPWTQDESFEPMADTDTFGEGAKEPTYKSKAPHALDLSYLSPPLLSSRKTTNKSAADGTTSCASIVTHSVDSDCLGETVHVRKVQPHPQLLKWSDDEQHAIDLNPTIRRQSARSYMTMTSVWSQESGYTMSQPPDAESDEQLVASVRVPGVVGDQIDVRGAMSRQTAPHGRRTKAKSRRQTFGPLHEYVKPKSSGPSRTVFLPNGSVV